MMLSPRGQPSLKANAVALHADSARAGCAFRIGFHALDDLKSQIVYMIEALCPYFSQTTCLDSAMTKDDAASMGV
jgi:hypothetical protein